MKKENRVLSFDSVQGKVRTFMRKPICRSCRGYDGNKNIFQSIRGYIAGRRK